jgi:hypothetical protein
MGIWSTRHTVNSTVSLVWGVGETSLHGRTRSPGKPTSTSRLRKRSPNGCPHDPGWPPKAVSPLEPADSESACLTQGSSYVRSEIFIAASPGDLHWDNVARARWSSQRELSRALVTRSHFQGATRTFRVWPHALINVNYASSNQSYFACCFLICLTIEPWRWRQYVPPKVSRFLSDKVTSDLRKQSPCY